MSEKKDDIELRSEEVKDILTKVPHWMIRWGSILFLILFLLVIVLTWFIKYPDIITAEAILTTEIQPQKEYARVSGTIDTIYVKDNQLVNKNSLLAILENTANYKDVYYLKSILDTLVLDKNQISFPFDKLPLLFLGDIESDFSQFENNYFQYLINKELDPLSNEAIANKISKVELDKRLNSLVAQLNLTKSELAFKKKDLKRNKSLFEKGVISSVEFENKELEYLISQKSNQTLSITISQLRESIGNAANITKATEFNIVREEIRLLKNVLQAYNQLKKAIKEWEITYVLKSNIEGKVSYLNFWNSNQTVNSGDLVFTIIPTTDSPYIAKLRTPSTNSGKIQLGQKVNLSLYDYPEYEFGVIRGTVSKISETSNLEGTYVVDVSIPKDLISSYGKPIVFKQEMKGEADIITEDLSLLGRLFYTFRTIFKR